MLQWFSHNLLLVKTQNREERSPAKTDKKLNIRPSIYKNLPLKNNIATLKLLSNRLGGCSKNNALVVGER
jgi:hypothetical protein